MEREYKAEVLRLEKEVAKLEKMVSGLMGEAERQSGAASDKVNELEKQVKGLKEEVERGEAKG